MKWNIFLIKSNSNEKDEQKDVKQLNVWSLAIYHQINEHLFRNVSSRFERTSCLHIQKDIQCNTLNVLHIPKDNKLIEFFVHTSIESIIWLCYFLYQIQISACELCEKEIEHAFHIVPLKSNVNSWIFGCNISFCFYTFCAAICCQLLILTIK